MTRLRAAVRLVPSVLVRVNSGMDRGIEVAGVESPDQLVALELRSDRVLELGEDDRDALGVEFFVEGEQHVGGGCVDVGGPDPRISE